MPERARQPEALSPGRAGMRKGLDRVYGDVQRPDQRVDEQSLEALVPASVIRGDAVLLAGRRVASPPPCPRCLAFVGSHDVSVGCSPLRRRGALLPSYGSVANVSSTTRAM
jgi:hypothetical protein